MRDALIVAMRSRPSTSYRFAKYVFRQLQRHRGYRFAITNRTICDRCGTDWPCQPLNELAEMMGVNVVREHR